MGKIYSGLYQYNGHVVPYVVVVKAGKPSEKKKPGNRYFPIFLGELIYL
jgi:chitin synthase